MFQQLDPATLHGHAGTGVIYVKRAPDAAVTEAAGRWVSGEPVRHQDLDDAYQAHSPISYVGPIDDPEFPGVARSGEIEALVILIQENKGLAGEVMMYTYILDPVRPLKLRARG